MEFPSKSVKFVSHFAIITSERTFLSKLSKACNEASSTPGGLYMGLPLLEIGHTGVRPLIYIPQTRQVFAARDAIGALQVAFSAAVAWVLLEATQGIPTPSLIPSQMTTDGPPQGEVMLKFLKRILLQTASGLLEQVRRAAACPYFPEVEPVKFSNRILVMFICEGYMAQALALICKGRSVSPDMPSTTHARFTKDHQRDLR